MSPEPYPFFSVSQHDKPEQIKVKISMLIKLYMKTPDPLIAKSVAKLLAVMLAQPKYISHIEQRCQLRKLEMHWRCLAWVSTESKLTKTKRNTR